MNEQIVILDFGSQYTQVIARRVRECQVYSTILRYDTSAKEIAAMKPSGLILSGGPSSVYARKAPLPDKAIFDLGLPVLGICYGVQIFAHFLDGKVEPGQKREYGKGTLAIKDATCALFRKLPDALQVWNSHGDKLTKIPQGFVAVATTGNSDYAAIEHHEKHFFGLQFHPEVAHTPRGREILANFVHGICGCGKNWTMRHYIAHAVEVIRAQVGPERVVLGLSGGVDSSVAAALLHKAIGDQLTCIFVNNGLLRFDEYEDTLRMYKENLHLNVLGVDASEDFYAVLKDIVDPEAKRKAIGAKFIDIFDAEAHKIGDVKWLVQGTLYPDVIESVSLRGASVTIKTHHNVGGLPEKMNLKLIEPLRELFKDEVRNIGRDLGIPEKILERHPFPGPGLGVRILGDITREKVELLQKADKIFIEELHSSGLYKDVWQAFAVLLPIQSVGVMGDFRTYEKTVAIRAVTSTDGMTADWARLPHDFLARVSSRITSEVRGVNRVVYDISSKPPSTIEWE